MFGQSLEGEWSQSQVQLPNDVNAVFPLICAACPDNIRLQISAGSLTVLVSKAPRLFD